MSRDMAVLVDGFARSIVQTHQGELNEDAEDLTAQERGVIQEGCRRLLMALNRADDVEAELDHTHRRWAPCDCEQGVDHRVFTPIEGGSS